MTAAQADDYLNASATTTDMDGRAYRTGEGAAPARPSNKGHHPFRWIAEHMTGRALQLKRLEAEFVVVQYRVKARFESYARQFATRTNHSAHTESPDAAEARSYLDATRRAIEEHAPAKGWALLHRAEECEVSLLDDSEIVTRAIALEREVGAEGTSVWQLDAVGNLLAQMSHRRAETPPAYSPPTRPPWAASGRRHGAARDRALLRRAMELRDDYYRNRYSTLEVSAVRRLLLLMMGVVLLLLVGIIMRDRLPITTGGIGPWVAGSMAVAGMIGSITSAIQRLATDPNAPTPWHLGSFTATLTRPFIGAIAALTLFLAVSGGLITIEGDPITLLILAAFGAGFAERLVVYQPATK
jgi:hypothetical protein